MSFTHFSLISWATTVDTIVPFFFAHLILASALGLTKPASGSRPYIVVLILACCLVSVRSSASRRVPGEIGGEYVIGFVFHASHFLCLVKLSPPEGLNWRDRYSWAVNQLFEARWGISPQILPAWGNNRRNGSLLSETHQPGTGLQQISMKGETDNPSPQAAREIDDDNVPSKRAFILARLWDLSWTVLALWFFGHFKLLIFPDDITSVPDGFLHRLGNISGREMAIRVYMTFLGLVTPYCTLRAAHSLASVLTVALGDLPKRWPPLFGSIGDAYTVRRFYAYFWHHLMRKAFTSHAVFFVNNVLRLPRNSQISRYLIIMLTFMISAGLHIVSGIAPVRCAFYAQTRYYFSIAATIMLEDAVIWVYKSAVKDAATKPDDPRTMLWHLIGYSWVAFFHTWSISKFIFQSYTCARA